MNPEQDDVTNEAIDSFAYNSIEPLECPNGGKIDALGWCVWWDADGKMHREKPVFKGFSPVRPDFDWYASKTIRPKTLISPADALYNSNSVETGGEIPGQLHYE